MEADLSKLLAMDIERVQKQLEAILFHLPQTGFSKQVADEGLAAAHTLKALSAVKGMAHLEAFSAQLEQLFLKAREHLPEDIYPQVSAYTKVIQREFREASKLLQAEKKKIKTSKGLNNLVEGLYTVDRQRAEKSFHHQRKQVNAESHGVLIEAIFRSFAPWVYQIAHTSGKQVELEYRVPKAIVLNIQSAVPLQTILVHLLRNALFHGLERPEERYAARKRVMGTIQLCAEIEESSLVIIVSDDGVGLPQRASEGKSIPSLQTCQATESTAFDAKDTILETSIYDASNLQTGLGIGLHIVRTEVEKHGGEFELKSIPGMATLAILRFPYARFRDEGNA
jgi:chemotaxis protein histidine kinase CheA